MFEGYLAKGDPLPPKKDGKLRLYTAGLSPYGSRVLLVLIAKGVPHDVVNINLQNKPDWITDLNPAGKIPILDTGSEILVESLDICDYLNQTYPDPPLYPKDEKQKVADMVLINSYDAISGPLFGAMHNKENKSLAEHMEIFKPHVDMLENELEKRGTYLGGESPKMVDWMLWPWAEKVGILELQYKEKPVPDEAYPRLKAWCKAMHTQKAVKETFISAEEQYKILLAYKASMAKQ